MILTKDNLLRYVREKKAVTPTMVSEDFETTTMIASAALSEISKDKSIAITYLKLASSPYYYDPKQKEYLIEIGEKHLSKYEKDIFLKLKQHEILSDNSLTIQERLAIEKIRDFAIPLEVNTQGKELKFWVWYLRDFNETKTQILEALNPVSKPTEQIKQEQKKEQTIKQPQIKQEQKTSVKSFSNNYSSSNQIHETQTIEQPQFQPKKELKTQIKVTYEDNKNEVYIENYFKEHYLSIENKIKQDKGINYNLSLRLNNLKIQFDSYYYYKKTTENEIMKFYTSSLKPKIIFVENAPKKITNMADNLENLYIIDLR